MAKKPKPIKNPKPVTTRYRSAVTGRFVSKSYGKTHPKTTIKETRRTGSRHKR